MGERISIEEISEFIRRFYLEQYRWCPVIIHTDACKQSRLEDRPGLVVEYYLKEGNRVLPFYVRRRVKHAGFGHSKSTGKGKVWQIEVPEEFVSEELRRRLPYAQICDQEVGNSLDEHQAYLQQRSVITEKVSSVWLTLWYVYCGSMYGLYYI